MKLDEILASENPKALKAASKKTPVEFDAAFGFAQEHCSRYINNLIENNEGGCCIYRGFDNAPDTDYFICDASNISRQSRYAFKNYYTLLMDNLPEWSAYPKRSQSLISSQIWSIIRTSFEEL